MERKEHVLDLLKIGHGFLHDALRETREINKTEQFNYITDPKVSDKLDDIEIIFTQLKKIIYQEK